MSSSTFQIGNRKSLLLIFHEFQIQSSITELCLQLLKFLSSPRSLYFSCEHTFLKLIIENKNLTTRFQDFLDSDRYHNVQKPQICLQNPPRTRFAGLISTINRAPTYVTWQWYFRLVGIRTLSSPRSTSSSILPFNCFHSNPQLSIYVYEINFNQTTSRPRPSTKTTSSTFGHFAARLATLLETAQTRNRSQQAGSHS